MSHPLFLCKATLPILNSEFLEFNTIVLTFRKKVGIALQTSQEMKNSRERHDISAPAKPKNEWLKLSEMKAEISTLIPYPHARDYICRKLARRGLRSEFLLARKTEHRRIPID